MHESSFFAALEDTSRGPAMTRCPVRLSLTDGRQLDADIYLLPDPMRPGGVVTVEGTVDGPRDFIPVCLGGTNALLSRGAIRTLEMSAEGPGTGDILEAGGSLDVASMRIDSGETISGVIVTMAPAAAMRMSDVFNRPGRFLTVRDGDKLILVSKAHLVQASF
jgi:hypothetical protein